MRCEPNTNRRRESSSRTPPNSSLPMHWPECSDFWCEMKCVEGPAEGQARFREVVSANCDDGALPGFLLPEFRAETELLFNFMWIPQLGDKAEAAVANYRLVPDPRDKDDLIVLDEGTLVVAEVEGEDKLLVTTTKRVRFSREFVPGAIAVMACAFGYGDLSNGMMERAVKGRGIGLPGGGCERRSRDRRVRAGVPGGGPGQRAAGWIRPGRRGHRDPGHSRLGRPARNRWRRREARDADTPTPGWGAEPWRRA